MFGLVPALVRHRRRQRCAARRRPPWRRPAIAARARHAGRRRSRAVAGPAGGRGPADPQLRRAAERRSRLPGRRRAHRARAAVGRALQRATQTRSGFFTDAIVAHRRASPACRAPPASASCRCRRAAASAPASIASIGRRPSRGRIPRRPTCGRSRPASSGRWAFRSWRAAISRRRIAPTSPPVAVVSETLARQQFPGENPLGKRLQRRHRPARRGMNDAEIVGVVGDIKMAVARCRDCGPRSTCRTRSWRSA